MRAMSQRTSVESLDRTSPGAADAESRVAPGSIENSFRYQQVLHELPAALYICDAQGRIQYYNEVAAQLWGRRPEPGEFWCGSYRLYFPDGSAMPLDQCPMAISLREGRSVRGQKIMIERPDGTRRVVLPHPDPLRDASGHLVGAVNLLLDVTDQHRAEEAQSRLAAIVESSDDAIVSKTLQGVITSWNAGAQRLFGYTAEEAVGQDITLIIPPDRRDEETTILARLSRGERIDHYETIRQTKHGKRIDISLTISPVRDSSGRVIGASKIARDITARKNAEEALREADRRKDEFLAVLAHELRNPLAPLRSGLQIIQMSGEENKVIDQARAIMQRQVDHMVRLIDDLLDVSRISRGKLELRKGRITVSSVVQAAVETCDPLIKQHGQLLSINLPAEPLFINADQVRITQVIGNVLCNASKFSPRGGKIELSVEHEETGVSIRIKDNGCGIPPDMLERIFELFTQAQRPLEHTRSGLGIGLTLVRQLVGMHGGKVQALSEGPGKGSEFVLSLPLAESPADAQPCGADNKLIAPARKRVLVADDNHDAAECLAVLLEMMGNDVRTARDGKEAVHLAEQFRPDLILLDLGMPGMNGYDAAKFIREQGWGRDMRLVALSGWGQDEDKQRSRAAGFEQHLVKPADLEALEKLLS